MSCTSSITQRVFVVDDDSDLRETLVEALRDAGYEVEEAGNGDRALEALAEAADGLRPAPDTVLLDVWMPGLSGLGILRALRQFAHPPRAVLMTGLSDASVDLIARRYGAHKVLHKPFKICDVCTAIEEAETASRRFESPRSERRLIARTDSNWSHGGSEFGGEMAEFGGNLSEHETLEGVGSGTMR